jgi:hypothetical protein
MIHPLTRRTAVDRFRSKVRYPLCGVKAHDVRLVCTLPSA